MTEIIAGSLAAKRFAMALLGVFAALATVLSSVGIYGVISYVASQRRMVLSQAGRMAVIGVAIGVVAAFGLMRLMSNLLFGVSTHDPITFLGVAALLIVVALGACYVPARRATTVEPMVALRYE